MHSSRQVLPLVFQSHVGDQLNMTIQQLARIIGVVVHVEAVAVPESDHGPLYVMVVNTSGDQETVHTFSTKLAQQIEQSELLRAYRCDSPPLTVEQLLTGQCDLDEA